VCRGNYVALGGFIYVRVQSKVARVHAIKPYEAEVRVHVLLTSSVHRLISVMLRPSYSLQNSPQLSTGYSLGEHQHMSRRLTEVRNITLAPGRVMICRSPAHSLDTTQTGLYRNPITLIRSIF
jgi:hypothetical protein